MIATPATSASMSNATPASRTRQLMIADSLVLVASISAKGSPEEQSLADSATFQLGFAGSAGARNPYRGAGVRLQRLLDATSDRSVESIAIYSLSQLADSTQARDALRQLIMRNRRAARAISLLQMYHGEAGLETLRQVYSARPTLEFVARQELDRLARIHGWKLDSQRR